MASTFSILFSSLSLYKRNSSSGIEISVPDLEASYCEYRRKLTESVIHCSLVSNEPPRGKTNNVVSDQVRHKPTCRVTEKS